LALLPKVLSFFQAFLFFKGLSLPRWVFNLIPNPGRLFMNKIFRQEFHSLPESVANNIPTDNLSYNQHRYIREIVGTVETLMGKGSVHAVVLFGSLSYGDFSPLSDVDLLLILDNMVPHSQIRKIDPILKTIEIKYGWAAFPHRFDEKIIHVIERNTGMFCSHFICRHEDWVNRRFSKIFATTRWITKLLAPNEIVLNSMKMGAKILYGDLDLSVIPAALSSIQLLKSVFMNLMIGFGSFLLLPLRKKNIKYLVEAYKWSLRAAYCYVFHKVAPIKTMIPFFKRSKISDDYLNDFMALREELTFNIRFCLLLPFQIIKVHLIAVQCGHFLN